MVVSGIDPSIELKDVLRTPPAPVADLMAEWRRRIVATSHPKSSLGLVAVSLAACGGGGGDGGDDEPVTVQSSADQDTLDNLQATMDAGGVPFQVADLSETDYAQPSQVDPTEQNDALGVPFDAGSPTQRLTLTDNDDVNAVFNAPPFDYRWQAENGIITFSFHESAVPGENLSEAIYRSASDGSSFFEAEKIVFNENQRAVTREAFKEFSKVANLTFVEVSEDSGVVGDLRFAGTEYAEDDVYASAYILNADQSNPVAGDIWASSDMMADGDWAVGKTWAYMVLVHEIGHALGLGHPDEGLAISPELDFKNYTVMSLEVQQPSGYWENGVYYNYATHLMVYDIAAIQHLYGANYDHNAGDTIYRFDPDVRFVETIWDGGGTDLLDLSNFSEGSYISLVPGSYSTIGYDGWDYDDNLGIAFDCIIENANGTSGRDTIIGNAADNELNGGRGSDVLFGNAGDDRFDWAEGLRQGSDTFHGGEGNDYFVLDRATDTVVEFAGEGFDTVFVDFSGSYELADHVEALVSLSETGSVLTGNAEDNVILGSDADDRLTSVAGSDVLTGGAGADAFVLMLGARHCIITDFDVAEDELFLRDALGAEVSIDGFDQTVLQSHLLLSSGDFSVELQGVDAMLIA